MEKGINGFTHVKFINNLYIFQNYCKFIVVLELLEF